MKKTNEKPRRGLAPRAPLAQAASLAALERPSVPAAALVRAALEREEPAPEAEPEKGRKLREIPLAEIDLGKRRFQYRVTRNLARLKESLLLKGQQVPVILRGESPPYEIVAGFGRCDALSSLEKEAKLEDVRVFADVRGDLSDRDAHEISVLENEDREGLTDLDRISKARRLKEEGYQVSEIASVLKKGERMVQYYLSLSEAPKAISDAIERGELRPTHALVLTRFSRDALSELTPEEVEAKLLELMRHCQRGASVPELRALASGREKPSLLVPRGEGFELRGFRFSPAVSEDEKRALLSVLDEAREWITRGRARSGTPRPDPSPRASGAK